MNAVPRSYGRLGQVEPQDALDETVGLVGFDAVAAYGFGDLVVRRHERRADLVHDVIDESLDHRDERFEIGQHRTLLRALHDAEDDIGVGQALLEFGEALHATGRVDVAHAIEQ